MKEVGQQRRYINLPTNTHPCQSSLDMLHATMKTTLLLFCSLVCVATNASETDLDKVCTEPLPAVDNAEVLEEYRGDNYTHGSVLPFTCRLGYVSAGRTMYSCSNAKWVRVRKGKCVPRPCELPEDIPNGKYDLVDGTDLVFGATIKYTCDEGYQMMSRFHTRVCMVDGWSNSLPVCEAVACLSEDNPSLIVRGLPEDDTPITYGHKLQFECADSGMVIRGEQEVTCTSAGQWNHPFPRCEVVTCELERTYSSVNVRGLPANGGPVKYGTTLYFTCAQDGMTIKGTREVTCTSTGEWSAPFPKCEEKPPLPNGSCGPPPPVAFGSIVQGLKTVYSHDDWVKFQCPYYYILKGRTWYPSWMRCNEGKWENESMKCLRPCTVTSEDMDKRNIQFQYPRGDLRYVKHDDHVTFMCKPGTMNRKAQFGQYCNNGHMDLPICYKYNY
ncbi:complement factor H-like isoform X2 [Sardina pilchardus]|uniref:complement factor H-like isoform X2 n=1 Tax=Sardina pilchardus TaxID=27697 RepID=UPI002E11B879